MAKQVVYLALDFMKPDATQYKPVDIQMRPPKGEDLLVEFAVNEENVVADNSGGIVLTPEGLEEIASQMLAIAKQAYWQFEDWASDTLKKKR
jgi:hypothetical protein